MKKIWKISVCALAMAFTFSAVTACDKGEKEEKSNISADQVLALGDSIKESLADVQSFNFGFSMKSGQSGSSYKKEDSVTLSALANITETDISAKMTATTASKMSMQGMPEYSETSTLAAYIVDGFTYEQDEDDETGKTYIKSSRPFSAELSDEFEAEFDLNLTEVLEQIMAAEGEIEMPEIPTDLIKDVLNDEFTLIKKGDTTRVTLDLKQEFNDVMNYVGNLSVNTTVGDVVNYVLGHIDEDLTWQDITGAIKDKGGYTVSTIVNVLDNELYNASGMRLQEVKDTVLADPDVYALLAEEMGADMADALVNTTVAELLTEYGAMTVDNLIQMASEDETATLSSAVEGIETMLTQMTLGDTMEEEDKAMFATISVFKGVRADDLNANLIFTVKNDKITRVEVSYNVKISISAQGESMTFYANYSTYAENFSSQAQTIALPTGITVKIYCNDCGWSVTDGDYCDDCLAYICEDCHSGVHND